MAETPPLNPASLYGAVDLSSLVQRANAPAGQAPGASAAPTPGQPAEAGQPAAGEPVATLPDVVIDADEQTLEQFMQLSQFLPVIVEMHAKWSSDAQALSPVLAKIVRSAEGRIVLVRVDLDAHQQLGQQPQVIAIIGGRPLQLFSGNPPEEQITQIVGEILQVAAQQGLTGHVAVDGAPQGEAEEQEPVAPPLHAEAFEALERGDYAAAIDAYERALTERPADDEARAGLAQVQLLVRLQGKTLEEIRQRAAAGPDDLDAQLDVADLDLSGGHIDDAFDRLLTLFPKLDAEGKTAVRERLLDLFLVVGVTDPRVGSARARLTNLLF